MRGLGICADPEPTVPVATGSPLWRCILLGNVDLTKATCADRGVRDLIALT
jgi:hypothetical protein